MSLSNPKWNDSTKSSRNKNTPIILCTNADLHAMWSAVLPSSLSVASSTDLPPPPRSIRTEMISTSSPFPLNTCSGVLPSLSSAATSAPWSIRQDTIRAELIFHAECSTVRPSASASPRSTCPDWRAARTWASPPAMERQSRAIVYNWYSSQRCQIYY